MAVVTLPDGCHLYYEVSGPARGTALVLLEGMGGDIPGWRRTIPHVARHHRVNALKRLIVKCACFDFYRFGRRWKSFRLAQLGLILVVDTFDVATSCFGPKGLGSIDEDVHLRLPAALQILLKAGRQF